MNSIIIIGSGPAAYTAAIYAARANYNPLIFEGEIIGGQLTTTTIVENYPGFEDGIDGKLLMDNLRKQVLKLLDNSRLIQENVTRINTSIFPFEVFVNEDIYKTCSIIIATGATAKKLDIPGGETYWNKGISACAVCDGFLPIFRNKPLAVVGGGDSACEEALHLSKFASKIYLCVRKNCLRASKIMQQRVLKNEKIEILFNTEIIEALGDKKLQSIQIINNLNNFKEYLNVNGLFYAIGHSPNIDFLDSNILCDANGYILTTNTKTNIPGIFACGDVQDNIYRQAITAAASGCMAALECEKYLENI